MQTFKKISPTRPHWAELVIESPCPYVCAIKCSFFLGISLALRSHDQIPASHWSTHPHPTPPKKNIYICPPPPPFFENCVIPDQY